MTEYFSANIKQWSTQDTMSVRPTPLTHIQHATKLMSLHYIGVGRNLYWGGANKRGAADAKIETPKASRGRGRKWVFGAF